MTKAIRKYHERYGDLITRYLESVVEIYHKPIYKLSVDELRTELACFLGYCNDYDGYQGNCIKIADLLEEILDSVGK